MLICMDRRRSSTHPNYVIVEIWKKIGWKLQLFFIFGVWISIEWECLKDEVIHGKQYPTKKYNWYKNINLIKIEEYSTMKHNMKVFNSEKIISIHQGLKDLNPHSQILNIFGWINQNMKKQNMGYKNVPFLLPSHSSPVQIMLDFWVFMIDGYFSRSTKKIKKYLLSTK